ncbi:MAG: hypothetical protein ACYC97_13775 [Metallibacterium sp.]
MNPPFAVSARVVVRCKFSQVVHEEDLSAMDFESALVIKGRTSLKSDSDMILGFTEQFADWVRGSFLPAVRIKLASASAGQLDSAERWFDDWHDYHVDLGSRRKRSFNNVTFKYSPELEVAEAANNTLEVIVLGRQMAQERPI